MVINPFRSTSFIRAICGPFLKFHFHRGQKPITIRMVRSLRLYFTKKLVLPVYWSSQMIWAAWARASPENHPEIYSISIAITSNWFLLPHSFLHLIRACFFFASRRPSRGRLRLMTRSIESPESFKKRKTVMDVEGGRMLGTGYGHGSILL